MITILSPASISAEYASVADAMSKEILSKGYSRKGLVEENWINRCTCLVAFVKRSAYCENAWPTSAFVSMLSNAATEKENRVKFMPMLVAHDRSSRFGFSLKGRVGIA